MLFGYKALIPAVGYTALIVNVRYGIANAVLTLLGMAVAFVVYRRGVRFKKSDILTLVVPIPPGLPLELL